MSTRETFPTEVDPSPLAYEILHNFEDILQAEPAWRPSDAPHWTKSNTYKIGENIVSLRDADEALLLGRVSLRRFDGNSPRMLWLPSGVVSYGYGTYTNPEIYKEESYLIGRRVSKGDPREGIILPAVFSVPSAFNVHRRPIGVRQLRHEDISGKTERLSKLAGWLVWIQQQSTQSQEIVKD